MPLRTGLAYPIIGLVVLSVFVTTVTLHHAEVKTMRESLRSAQRSHVKAHHDLIRGHIDRAAITIAAALEIYKKHDLLVSSTSAFFESGGFDGRADRTNLKAVVAGLGLWEHMDDIIVTDPNGKVIVRADSPVWDDTLEGWGVAEAMSGKDMVLTTFTHLGWEIRAISALKKGETTLGTVVVSLMIDDAFAHELSKQFDCKASFGNLEGIFASALPPERRSGVDRDLMIQVLREKATGRMDIEGASITAYYAPLKVVDEIFCLIVEKDTSDAKALLAQKGREALVFSLLISALVSILGMLFALKLIRPLRKLKEDAQAIAKEIADENLEDIRGDEIANLVHVFDAMADAIKRHLKRRNVMEVELKRHRNRLEKEVAERTEHLNNANKKLHREIGERVHIEAALRENKRQLEETLHTLKQTQATMIQSEKMASVGQLAAGIAHEINNPTGYLASNLHTLATYEEDLRRLYTEYNELVAHGNDICSNNQIPEVLQERFERVDSLESELDVAFIMDDMPNLIKESRDGALRIQNIVNALKGFAHPGESDARNVDINDCLESTLKVVWNELKYKADVTKAYGQLPAVQCYPQQLNQVFMNILVNAAQAIKEKGRITITTSVMNGSVLVSIQDTGVGISKEDMPNIFNPFFTTKEVGKGTGLGLHIAYDITTSHGGSIEVESAEGQGTTFTISLPHV